MSQIRLDCGVPFCQNSQEKQTNLSAWLRVTAIVIGILGMIVGSLILTNTITSLGRPAGWAFVSLSSLLLLISSTVRCIALPVQPQSPIHQKKQSVKPAQPQSPVHQNEQSTKETTLVSITNQATHVTIEASLRQTSIAGLENGKIRCHCTVLDKHDDLLCGYLDLDNHEAYVLCLAPGSHSIISASGGRLASEYFNSVDKTNWPSSPTIQEIFDRNNFVFLL